MRPKLIDEVSTQELMEPRNRGFTNKEIAEQLIGQCLLHNIEVGSAWMPCVRPTHSVFSNSKVRRLQVSPRARISSMMMSHAWVIW